MAVNTAPNYYKQAATSPLAKKGYASIAAKYAPKDTAGNVASGWKGVGGVKGGAIGIGGSIAANYLKPKADAVRMGGAEFGDLTDKYKRREAGPGSGIAANAIDWGTKGMQYGGYYGAAIGAAAGAIRGAYTKKAKSAYSDFLPGDARGIVADAYRKYLGRDPEAGAVEGWMTGQGWKPGDKGVGQNAMFEKLEDIKNSPEARARINPGVVANTAPRNFTPAAIPSSFLRPDTVNMLDERRRQQLGY